MQLHDTRAKCKGRSRVTAGKNRNLAVAPNLLDLQFTVAVHEKGWTGDSTDTASGENWQLLTPAMALLSRQKVGWSLREATAAGPKTKLLRNCSGASRHCCARRRLRPASCGWRE